MEPTRSGRVPQTDALLVAHALLVFWISERRWAAAVVLIIMRGGVLRPGEATSLRRRHISLPEDHGVAGLVVIVIEDPKTAHLGGAAIQHAPSRNPPQSSCCAGSWHKSRSKRSFGLAPRTKPATRVSLTRLSARSRGCGSR